MSDHDDGFILVLAKWLNSNIIFVALVWSSALVGSSNKIIGAEDKNALFYTLFSPPESKVASAFKSTFSCALSSACSSCSSLALMADKDKFSLTVVGNTSPPCGINKTFSCLSFSCNCKISVLLIERHLLAIRLIQQVLAVRLFCQLHSAL